MVLNEAADRLAALAAEEYALPAGHVQQCQLVDKGAWAIQNRLVAVAKLACDKPIPKFKASSGAVSLHPIQRKIGDLRALGHDIIQDGKVFRCVGCLKSCGTAGLNRFKQVL